METARRQFHQGFQLQGQIVKNSEAGVSSEVYYKVLKGTLLDATDRTWGLAKPSIRHVRNVSFSDNCGYVLNE